MTRGNCVGLVAISVGLCGCGSHYIDAAGKFASATSASSATLGGAVSINHRLCRRRATLDYLQHRAEGSNVMNGTPVYWDDWYSQFKLGGTGPTWQDQCKTFEVGDAAMGKALGALSAYAAALGVVAGNDYSGADIGSIVTDVGGLVAAVPSVPTTVGNAVKALGGTSSGAGPIGELAGVLKRSYAAGKVAEIVKDADPSVATALKVISRYVDAVGAVQSQWSTDTMLTIGVFDALLPAKAALTPPSAPLPPAKVAEPVSTKPTELAAQVQKGKARAPVDSPAPQPFTPEAAAFPGRPNPIDVITLAQAAQSWTQDIERTRAQQAALADACQKLLQAEQALAQANGSNSAPSLTTVLTLAVELLNDVAAVQTALQGDPT